MSSELNPDKGLELNSPEEGKTSERFDPILGENNPVVRDSRLHILTLSCVSRLFFNLGISKLDLRKVPVLPLYMNKK